VKTNRLFLMVAALMLSVSIQAQEVFKVGGGGGAKNGSVYSNMLGTLSERCSDDNMKLEEVQSKGGTANLASIKGNSVKAALIPFDVMAAARFDNASSVSNLKTLFTLHNEAAHLIARADVKKEGGVNLGFTKLGGADVAYNNAEDFKNRTIGAVGGSAVTARILSDMMKYQWKIDDSYESTSLLLAALTAGKVDGVLISAGLQSDAVKAVKGNFKLIPLRGNSDTQGVYSAVKVEYANLNGGRAVDTLASRALFVTRVFRDPEQLAKLAALRACFYKQLPKIQDADGTHPAWQDVNSEDRGDPRFWYELPNAQAASPTPKKK